MRYLLSVGFIICMTITADSNLNIQRPPFPVYLNHFFLVVDGETYADIEKNEFLRKQFAPNETRTTRRTDISYTGLYFYGRNTYFEFFDASKETKRKTSETGIAFGVEQTGASKILQKQLGSENPFKVTRLYNDKQVDWFYMLTGKTSSFTSGSSFWVMEYLPSFLREWNPQADNSAGIERRQILQRYTAVLKEVPKDPVFQDVLAITVALDENLKKSLIDSCKLFGYEAKTNGNLTTMIGADITLTIIPETQSRKGIQSFTFKYKTRPKRDEYRFGNHSVLRFGDNHRAVWSF
ncbi:MAG: DUF5829 family protein [Acidobacteriota bacterium]